jgi:FkbM family methyltransferase
VRAGSMAASVEKRPLTAGYRLADLLARLRREVANWFAVAALLQLIWPSRLFPHPALHRSWVGRIRFTIRLRSGVVIRTPLGQLGELLEIFIFPAYQVPELDLSQARNIIDVGASIGWATLWLAQRAPRARLVSIEPDPRWWDLFDQNVAANGVSDRVTLLKAAVGSSSGLGRLSLNRQTGFGELRSDDAGPTPVLSLAEAAAPILGDIDLVKLDCEGGEYGILLGADDGLLRRIHAITLEYHPVSGHSLDHLRNRLMESGFQVLVRPDDDNYGIMSARR